MTSPSQVTMLVPASVQPTPRSSETEATTHGLCDDCTADLLMSVVAPSPGPAVPRPRSHRIRSTVRRLNA